MKSETKKEEMTGTTPKENFVVNDYSCEVWSSRRSANNSEYWQSPEMDTVEIITAINAKAALAILKQRSRLAYQASNGMVKYLFRNFCCVDHNVNSEPDKLLDENVKNEQTFFTKEKFES